MVALAVSSLVLCFLFYHYFYKDTVRRSERYSEISEALNSDLGFEHASPYWRIEGELKEVFELNVTSSSSIFSDAGVEDGDIVLYFDFYDFYEALEQSRGDGLVFYVVPGGDGVRLENRQRKRIEVKVPKQ